MNDAVIFSAMALATLAAGAGAYVELGLSAWLASVLAMAVLAALAGVHLTAGRKGGGAARTDIDQLEAEIAKLNSLTRQAGNKDAPAPAPRQAPHPAARKIPVAMAAPGAVPPAADRQRSTPPPLGTGLPSPGTPLRDFRPHEGESVRANTPPALPARDAAPRPPAEAPARDERPRTQSPREADVEIVQGLVKKLADKVSAAESAAPPSSHAKPRMDGAIEASLEALRATANTMRAASEPAAPSLPARSAESAPRDGEPGEPRAALVAEALASGRADVLLEPILNLEDRRVRHYGAALRLKAANGEPIECQPARDPRDAMFGPALDGLRLARTAQLARRLAERGKDGFIFFEVGAAALGSDRFLAEFAALCHEPAAWVRQLAPAFTQADVAAFTSREWDALRDLGKFGLCFSIQALERLDMNFAIVKTWGFEFVEIDAARFLAGLPQGGKTVAAAEAARQIAAAGLTPIIKGIDEDAKLAPLVASGAVLGLGPLFGAPRPVKADALRNAA